MLRGVPELQRHLADICFEFQLSMEPVNKRLQAQTENPVQYVTSTLSAVVNSALRHLYGLEIGKASSERRRLFAPSIPQVSPVPKLD